MKIKNIMVVALVMSYATAQAGTQLYLRKGTVEAKQLTTHFSATENESKVREYVVQFKKSPSESDKGALISKGAEIFKYLPDDAYIIRADINSISAIKRLGQVNTTIPYNAYFKMSADFTGFSVMTAQKIENVLVKVFKSSELNDVISNITALSQDIAIVRADGNSILLNTPQILIAKIANISGIDHVQPYFEMTVLDPITQLDNGATPSADTPVANGNYTDLDGFEDGTKVMNFESAWKQGFTGAGQIVAMADTGLDSGDVNNIHADLKGAVVKGYIHGLFSKSWNDPMGHGTHVAGSVLSRGKESNGKIMGGAYEAKMIAQGMWSPMMDNLTVPPQLSTLFKSAYDDGARVHTNSWGAAKNFGVYDNFAEQVDQFVWDNPEMLPIFAAGNSGIDKNKDGRIDENSIGTPGTAKNVLTVGASENLVSKGGIQVPIKKLRAAADSWSAEPINSDFISNNINGIGMFSSRGPTTDGRVKPDVVAPGTNILSLKSQVEGASELWGAYNKWYAWSGGTSMATPLTAGAAVLTRQKLQKLGFEKPSAALVKGVLMHSAVDMYPGQFGEVGLAKGQELVTHRPNNDEGFGRVDMDRVVNLPYKIIDETKGVAQDQELAYEINVKNTAKKIWMTLIYTDAPASSAAAKTLVNNLDLIITSPSGKIFKSEDAVNNYELIELDQSESGIYKVSVKGTKIPQAKAGKLPFALIISATE